MLWTQLRPPLQTLPQLPQLAGSLVVSVQTLLQATCVPGQAWQLLPAQMLIDPHALAQPPQLAGSLVVSVQAFAQLVCPAGQQLLFVQLPASQALPQAPQLFGSLVVSMQLLLQTLCVPGQA